MLAVLLIVGITIWLSNRAGQSDSAAVVTLPPNFTRIASHPPPEFTNQMSIADITDTQYLKLVNRQHGISTPVHPALLVSAWPNIAVSTTAVTVHRTALYSLQELFAAARDENLRSLFIASGFRTDEEQQTLYQSAADKRYVMPPGHSEHHLGLGVDILFSGSYAAGGILGTPESAWLAQNAPQFGLVLRYPYDKQDITEVAYEPWHFRYVGRVHARLMDQYNFVLEEYIEFLRQNMGYQTTLDGKYYYILHQHPKNGMILVPNGMEFNVSSTNTGGYIVTAWR